MEVDYDINEYDDAEEVIIDITVLRGIKNYITVKTNYGNVLIQIDADGNLTIKDDE